MRALGLALALSVMLWTGSALADAITRGREITAANTGPKAAGYETLKPVIGGEIKDGQTYSFAREIRSSAIYDGFEVKGPHLLIEGVLFSAPLDISISKPVVFRGVAVQVPAGSPWTILVRPGAGPFYFLWSYAGGGMLEAGKAPGSGLQLRGDGAKVFRSRITYVADGIGISGADIAIAETLIDGLATFPGSHNDGIQLAETAANVTIVRNKIHNPNPQTSCIYVLGHDITIAANHLAGGGWTLYGGAKSPSHGNESASHVSVTGNAFGRDYFAKSGHFGPVSYWDKSSGLGNIWTGNNFDDGKPVTP